MSTTLPLYSRTIDTRFVQTWDKLKRQVADNVLKSNPVWAYLRKMGCFKPQVGGPFINRNVRYDVPAATDVARGDTLPMGETEDKTMAQWTWRWVATPVQKTMFDDQENGGDSQNIDYVKDRMKMAEEGMRQKYEVDVLRAEVTAETGKSLQGLNDMVPAFANRATGTYGRLARSNTFWQPVYRQLTPPYAVNLEADMRRIYNSISLNQEPPNFTVSSQSLFETYEDNVADKTQIVKGEGDYLADLGFSVLYWKKNPWVWTPNMTTDNMLMLNTNYIEAVYDPRYFFRLGKWKPTGPNTEDEIAHIVCAMNIISDQLRRHGRLYA